MFPDDEHSSLRSDDIARSGVSYVIVQVEPRGGVPSTLPCCYGGPSFKYRPEVLI